MHRQAILLILFSTCAQVEGLGQLKSESTRSIAFSGSSVALSPSWVMNRELLNTNYLTNLDPERLLHNFRVNAHLPSSATPLEGWESPEIGLRGHFTGHYLSALASLLEKTNDARLFQRAGYMVDELSKCQQALGGGYLSAFPEHDFDVLETRVEGVWAPYYTYHKIMQGLLDIYRVTGNRKALEVVVNMATYVGNRMSKLSDDAIEKIFYTAAANPTNEAGAMNSVLYQLYKITKDADHLALAKVFDRNWFYKPLAENKDILSGLHSNTHLVLVSGFADRYEITGEPEFHNAVVNFWDILQHHTYANGSSSGPRPNVTTPTSLTAEHWGVADQLSNTMTREIAESCVSYNTQRLTSTLFSWTRDPKYADAYMNSFYNAVLPAQNSVTGTVVYHLPLGSPRQKAFLKPTDYKCCNASALQAFSTLNSGIYYHDDKDVWVNLYVPSSLNWKEKKIQLTQTGDLPWDRTVEFNVSVATMTNLSINFFIPSWAKSAAVYVNGQPVAQKTQPMSFMMINRTWRNNDKVKIVFDFDFQIKSMPDDPNVIALFYGPVMLAFETTSELILRSRHSEILKNLSAGNDHTFRLTDKDKLYVLRPLFDIGDQSYGVYATIRDY